MDKNELQAQLEAAATALLSDSEIVTSLGITTEELQANYSVVERARVRLKQSLNAKRISNAAHTGNTGELVTQIPAPTLKPKGTRGGYRPGSGRPKGAKDRVTIAGLLSKLEYDGKDYETMLMEDFYQARQNDPQLTAKYHTLILNKIMPTLSTVEVDETNTQESRQAAFLKAFETIGYVAQDQQNAEDDK